MNTSKTSEASASTATPHKSLDPTNPLSQKSQSIDLQGNSSVKKVGKWTFEEDELLRKYVTMYSEKQWKKISEHIAGRAPIQCLHRWTKILKPGLVKGPWTPEEDRKLTAWVQNEGPGKWAQAANLIPGRSGKQCRERWFNNLNPEVRKGNWTQEEDELIFELYKKYGSSWSKISRQIPGRTENSIKNRFYSTLRKVATAKHRNAVHAWSPQELSLGDAQKDNKEEMKNLEVKLENGQGEGGDNILYNLLQETSEKEGKRGSQQQENDENMDVKQEEEDKKLQLSTKVSIVDTRKILAESNKGKTEQRQFSQIVKEKARQASSLKNVREIAHEFGNKVTVTPKETDPEFERFLLSIDHNSNYLMRDVDHLSENKSFEDLDVLQQKVTDFCHSNLQGSRTLLSAISLESPRISTSSKSTAHPETLKSMSIEVDSHDLLQRLPLLEQRKQGFSRPSPSFQQLGSIGPIRPIAIKIPPLEIKEIGGETHIPKLGGSEEWNFSSQIPKFVEKGEPHDRELSSVVSLTRPSKINKQEEKEGFKKEEMEEEKISPVADENLNKLIESMNQTIGTASLVYSHYVNQINDSLNKQDRKMNEDVKGQVGDLFQRIYTLNDWLTNAKAELRKLESVVDKKKDERKENEGIHANRKKEDLGGKRRLESENTDEAYGDQIVKKRKVESSSSF